MNRKFLVIASFLTTLQDNGYDFMYVPMFEFSEKVLDNIFFKVLCDRFQCRAKPDIVVGRNVISLGESIFKNSFCIGSLLEKLQKKKMEFPSV